MTEKIREEINRIRKNPVKIVVSAVVMIFMLVLAAFAWDGITKRLIICLGLSVLSGILLLLPKLPNKVSIPLLIAYLCYVPLKIFERMELPIHDMERVVDEATALTVAFIICAYLAVFLVTQSSAMAVGGGSGLFLILFLVEYYIWKFRGDFLKPSDLTAAGTAITVMKSYDYALSPEALYTVIYFLFFIILGLQIRIHMKKGVHIGVSAAAILFIGGWYYTVMDNPRPLGREFELYYWDMSESRRLNGASLSYFLLLRDSKIDIPSEYSEENLQTIAKDAGEKYEKKIGKTEQNPDIIMIMSEAWSDPRVLGELETTPEYMSFVDELTKRDNVVKGNLYVSILGGTTANTEFEALTGNSLSFLAPGVVPYMNQVQHDMPSLAQVLEDQGYETMAMHPNDGEAWNRKNVYSYFGFDEFIQKELWEIPYEDINGFMSDASDFNEIIYRYESRNRDVPFFLFNVTIQNHGAYERDEFYAGVDIASVGGISADQAGELYDLKTYLNLMKVSDDDFAKLIAYFEQADRPVIVCIFGDHQPRLSENVYDNFFAESELTEQEKNMQKYIVPYVIWANYDADLEDYGDMSANYLPAALMESAGLKLPPFYQYLMKLHREYPVLTQIGCLDKDGNLAGVKDIWDTDSISQYRMLQYNQLYVKDYQRNIFEEIQTGESEY